MECVLGRRNSFFFQKRFLETSTVFLAIYTPPSAARVSTGSGSASLSRFLLPIFPPSLRPSRGGGDGGGPERPQPREGGGVGGGARGAGCREQASATAEGFSGGLGGDGGRNFFSFDKKMSHDNVGGPKCGDIRFGTGPYPIFIVSFNRNNHHSEVLSSAPFLSFRKATFLVPGSRVHFPVHCPRPKMPRPSGRT